MTDPTPQSLDRLVRRLSMLIGAATRTLERDPSQAAQWEEEIGRQLARYHSAAYLAGAKAEELSPAARAAVTADLKTQLGFLGQFALEIQEAAEWQNGWNARAEMYAGSVKTPYWRGATQMLPLPAMPADGSNQCLTNCGCAWDIQQLDGDGNYDAYWVRGKNDSCQTCMQRADEWAPLRIRGGELQ